MTTPCLSWGCFVYCLLLLAGAGWTGHSSTETVDELGAKVILRDTTAPVVPYLIDWQSKDDGAAKARRGQSAPGRLSLAVSVTLRGLLIEYDTKRLPKRVFVLSTLVTHPRLLDQVIQIELGVDTLENIRRCCAQLGIPYTNAREMILLGTFQERGTK